MMFRFVPDDAKERTAANLPFDRLEEFRRLGIERDGNSLERCKSDFPLPEFKFTDMRLA